MRLKWYEDDDMIEGKSFYFHGTVVTIRTQEQRMKNQSNYNRQSEQREICEKKKKETRRYNHDMKNRSYHWQAIRAKGNMWNQANYNSKQKYANCFKRGKTRVTKSLLVLGLNLIGWKMAARSFWTNYTAKWNKLKQSRIYFPHSNENSSDSKEKQNIITK